MDIANMGSDLRDFLFVYVLTDSMLWRKQRKNKKEGFEYCRFIMCIKNKFICFLLWLGNGSPLVTEEFKY